MCPSIKIMTLIVFLLFVVLGSLFYGIPKAEAFQAPPQEKHLQDAINETKLRYHPAEDEIKAMYDFTQDYKEIIDDNGNTVRIPFHKTQGSLLAYTPGSRPHQDFEFDYVSAIRAARF